MPKRTNGNIQKLADGKYRLRLSCGFDDFGRRVQLSKVVEAKSEREAEKHLMELYAQREKLIQERGNGAPQTLGQLYAEWNKNASHSHTRFLFPLLE